MRASHQFITENSKSSTASFSTAPAGCQNSRLECQNTSRISEICKTSSGPKAGSRTLHTLAVSRYYDVDRPELEDTLIHEMIHLYLHWNGINDPTPTGPIS